jgi:cytochrome c554/c'-like protein
VRYRGIGLAGVVAAGVVTMAGWGVAVAEDAPADTTSAAPAATTSPAPAAAASPAPAAAASQAAPATHQYVGVKKCKACHNSEKGGAQFKKWSETKHAKAYETLAGPLAKSIAMKKGIADPQTAAACLQCHQTGHGEPANRFAATFVATDGVQCESCHGAGADYMKKKTMEGIANGTLKGEDYGLMIPSKERCVLCHNEQSPTFVEMNFASDSTKIAHPDPRHAKDGAGAQSK